MWNGEREVSNEKEMKKHTKEGLISPIYVKSFSQQGYGPDRDEAR